MPLKIWNIGKANSRIEELEVLNVTLTKERDEARTALEANSGEISAGAEQLQSDLATAKQTIGTLTGQVEAANKQIGAKDAEISHLKAEVAGLPQKVEVLVASKLATEMAALGQPPIPAPKSEAAVNLPVSRREKVHASIRADLEAAGYVRKTN